MKGIDPSQIGTEIGIGTPGNTSYSAAILTGLQADDVAILKRDFAFWLVPSLLWTTEGIDDVLFKTKGYSKLGQYTGIKAEGKNIGCPGNRRDEFPKPLLFELYSQLIWNQGMGGSPVLDLETNRVVGMVSQV